MISCAKNYMRAGWGELRLLTPPVLTTANMLAVSDLRHKPHECGGVLVESAFAMALCLLLVSGLVGFPQLLELDASLQDAMRTAGRYALLFRDVRDNGEVGAGSVDEVVQKSTVYLKQALDAANISSSRHELMAVPVYSSVATGEVATFLRLRIRQVQPASYGWGLFRSPACVTAIFPIDVHIETSGPVYLKPLGSADDPVC